MSPVWKLHMMTYNVTPLREILLKWIASGGQERPARSGRGWYIWIKYQDPLLCIQAHFDTPLCGLHRRRQTGICSFRLFLSTTTNQWTEKTHDREKKNKSHKVAEIKTGTNSCFFTSANTKCLTMQSKWLIWWMRNREKARKTSLGSLPSRFPVCLRAATWLQGQILPSD